MAEHFKTARAALWMLLDALHGTAEGQAAMRRSSRLKEAATTAEIVFGPDGPEPDFDADQIRNEAPGWLP